mmetsp:Transcript_10863/g.44476  ORF Transcript_10863/g.44476 Transcript_10863/m.44476 type:complete len:322 (+) Transcript_10863:911-1876(+)
MRPETVLMAVTPSAPPSLAAPAMTTTSVTLGVSLTKKGMVLASRTQREISRTIAGSWPQAMPMPRSPMPWGHERLSSIMSAPASIDFLVRNCQSSLLYVHMMLAITTLVGCFTLRSEMPLHQYFHDFSEMSSMLRKAPCCGPKRWPDVVPRMIRGDTLVTRSLSTPNVLVTAKPQPAWKPRSIISAEVQGVALARPNGFGNFTPQTSTLRSTLSMGEKNFGSATLSPTSMPWRPWRYLCIHQAACLPSLAASTVVPDVPLTSPPAKIHGVSVAPVTSSTLTKPASTERGAKASAISLSTPEPKAEMTKSALMRMVCSSSWT